MKRKLIIFTLVICMLANFLFACTVNISELFGKTDTETIFKIIVPKTALAE